jgi:hypothetical protein
MVANLLLDCSGESNNYKQTLNQDRIIETMNTSIVNEISLINLNSKVLIKNESININLNNNESQGVDDKFENIFF